MNSSVYVLLVCGITILLHDFTDGGKKGKNWKLNPGKERETCRAVTDNTSSVRLKCGSDDVIYTIDILSYNSSGCNASGCSGLQPQVLTDTLLCYHWNNCSIEYSNKSPIVKTDNAMCIGKTPSHIRLHYRCVRQEIFKALNRNGVNSGSDQLELDEGMLVSHATYPWHYRQGLTLSLTLTPKSSGRRRLYISVPVLDIDQTIDQVQLTNYTEEENKEFKDLQSTPAGTSVMFRASNKSEHILRFNSGNSSSTGKGFLICFYWANDDEDMSETDICSKVETKTKKKKRKGKKRKKEKGKGRKKGKGKKGKNRGKNGRGRKRNRNKNKNKN